MGRITFLLGGVRSGKSRHAQELAREAAARCGRGVLYVATATAGDEEMTERIARHRAARPEGWRTVEASTGVAEVVAAAGPETGVIVVDCLTLLVTNLMLAAGADRDVRPPAGGLRHYEEPVMAELDALLQAAGRCTAEVVLVANEVGMGVVPPSPLGRLFRDVAGRVNQRVAVEADEVYLLVAGLAQRLK